MRNVRLPAATVALLVITAITTTSAQQTKPMSAAGPKHSLQTAASAGPQTFASTCASCHGLDGRGGERAPNIATRPEIQHLTDAALTGIVQNGVPGAGMPAFHSLSTAEVKAVVGYLRTLQGAKQAVATVGNPVRGKELFV